MACWAVFTCSTAAILSGRSLSLTRPTCGLYWSHRLQSCLITLVLGEVRCLAGSCLALLVLWPIVDTCLEVGVNVLIHGVCRVRPKATSKRIDRDILVVSHDYWRGTIPDDLGVRVACTICAARSPAYRGARRSGHLGLRGPQWNNGVGEYKPRRTACR